VPPSGELAFELFLKELSLSTGPRAILDEDGAALVVHAGRDDYRTDPAGGAGRRIACAVIVR
jgi:Cu-Zn family superoxide dismutase